MDMEEWSANNTRFQIERDTGDGNDSEYDPPGQTFRPDSPEQYRWVLVQRIGEGPQQQERHIEQSPRFYDSIEAAEDSIRRFTDQNPQHGGLPVVHRT